MSLAPVQPEVEPARPFTGVALDRAGVERQDPERIRALLRDPAARAIAAGQAPRAE